MGPVANSNVTSKLKFDLTPSPLTLVTTGTANVLLPTCNMGVDLTNSVALSLASRLLSD
jgi:hypothetical protein